jgi:uncharacterized protein (TIGR02444 family)
MSMRNLFWEYSLSAYARPGVEEHCLRAQNALGADINQILYASWLASIDQRLNVLHLQNLDEAVQEWRVNVVEPLRYLRQQWRDYQPADLLREELKVLELRAEQEQQDMMWRYYLLAPALATRPQPLQDNLALLFRTMGCERDRWLPVVPPLLSALRQPSD